VVDVSAHMCRTEQLFVVDASNMPLLCHLEAWGGRAEYQNTRIAARTTVQRWSTGNTGFCGGVSEGVCTLKRAPQVFADVTVDACLW